MKRILIMSLLGATLLVACDEESIKETNTIAAEETNDLEKYPKGVREGKVSQNFYDSFKSWNELYKETSTMFEKTIFETQTSFIHRSTTEEQLDFYATQYTFLYKYKNNWISKSSEILMQTNKLSDEEILNATQNVEYALEEYMKESLFFLEKSGSNPNLDSASEELDRQYAVLKNLLTMYEIYDIYE